LVYFVYWLLKIVARKKKFCVVKGKSYLLYH